MIDRCPGARCWLERAHALGRAPDPILDSPLKMRFWIRRRDRGRVWNGSSLRNRDSVSNPS